MTVSPPVSDVRRLALDAAEQAAVEHVVQEALSAYSSADDQQFLRRVPVLTRRLPERLVGHLADFRLEEAAGACVVSGLAVDDASIGPSPLERRLEADRGNTRREEMLLVLVASLLGEVFGWSALQGGRLVQDLAPLSTEAREKSGYSSDSVLDPHTEDAFHPLRCDYLGLLCLRNHDLVPTTYAPIDVSGLDERQRRVLFESRFRIVPDPEHLRRVAKHDAAVQQPWLQPGPILFGDARAPYARVDAYFTEVEPGDEEAAVALRELSEWLERQLVPVVLGPGDILFIDNYRAVHGRRPFAARFDGTDRWLKRVNITRDLRRSRHARSSATDRVLS
jgi:L-asparagine oxygenase